MVILVEASGLLFKSYFRADVNRDGNVDVQAVVDAFWQRLYATERYGNKLVEDLNRAGMPEPPCRFVVCFDSPGNCRKDRVRSYKANRDTPPDSMLNVLKAASIQAEWLENWERVIAPEEWEADDVIASIAAQTVGHRVQIHSIDKDFLQCLEQGRVGIAKPKAAARAYIAKLPRLSVSLYTAKQMLVDYGFGPSRWVDYQCLVGDSADNIAGFPGVGDKLARKWLQEYSGPLELLPHDLMTPKKRAVYEDEFLPALDDLRFLLTLRTDLEIDLCQAL